MRVIVNADDFGFSAETVRATIECFEAGGLSSATIMPNMPATREALDYAKSHPQFSFGVHTTFVSDGQERPVSPPEQVPGLVDAKGYFHDSNKVRLLALLKWLPEEQLELELTAQLEVLADRGIPISHIDSHGHVHKFPGFRNALARTLPRFGVNRVRNVQNVYLRKPLKSPTFWLGRGWRRNIEAHFQTTQNFYMPATAMDRSWANQLLRVLDGTDIEVGVHPGYTQNWQDEEREEVTAFTRAARQAGHHIIGWNEL